MSPITSYLQEKDEINIQETALRFFPQILKDIKKKLPRACSFLSPLKTIDGEYQVRAVVKGDEFRITAPDNLIFTSADMEELHSVLLAKCK